MMTNVDVTTVRATPDRRVDRANAAVFLGYKAKTLAEWQRLGKGPRSHMVRGRRFYLLDDLVAFARGEAA